MATGTPIYVAPASSSEPTVDHEPSVSAAASRPLPAERRTRVQKLFLLGLRTSMAVSSISCSLRPPAPVREASARLTTQPSPPNTTTTPWADGLRRACVAAAAVSCVVIGAAGGAAGDVAASTKPRDATVVGVAAPRWSDRRECPPWRANSLENVVPENLPRPSARRRFSTVKRAPALGPRAVAPPFLALPYGVDECFTL